MKLWTWFCHLGTVAGDSPLPFVPLKQSTYPENLAAAASGGETVCTRLCGHRGCRCGGTIRGLHCVWSHYRIQ